jgi:hypothetical protein
MHYSLWRDTHGEPKEVLRVHETMAVSSFDATSFSLITGPIRGRERGLCVRVYLYPPSRLNEPQPVSAAVMRRPDLSKLT